MTLQGISGLRTFQLFSLKNLPSPYSEREIMCQIVDVSHKIDNGNWTTTIKAGIRSIRNKAVTFTTDVINEYKPSLIKMDIEGAEIYLKDIPVNVFDSVEEFAIEYHNPDCKKVITDKFEELGFEITALNNFGYYCTDSNIMGIIHAKRK
jgi:hypothetical protein